MCIIVCVVVFVGEQETDVPDDSEIVWDDWDKDWEGK